MPRQSKSKTDVTETVSAAPTSNATAAAPVVTKAKKETKPKAPKTGSLIQMKKSI